MRSRKFLFLVGLILFSMLGLILCACSSDDNTPATSNDDDDVDVQDPQLALVTNQVNAQVDSLVAVFQTGLDAATIESTDVLDRSIFRPSVADSSVISGNWIVYYYTDLQSGAGAIITVITDSIQFRRDGIPISSVFGADALSLKHHHDRAFSDTTVSYDDLMLYADLTFSSIDSDTATINGSLEAEISSKYVSADSTVWQDWDLNATIAGAKVSESSGGWDIGCPLCGTIQVTVDYTYKKDSSTPVSTSYTYDITFTNGAYSADVTYGDSETYSYNREVCSLSN